MARKPRDYAAEYAKRTAGTAKGSPERQRKRGHGAQLHPGTTEAADRRRREVERVREHGGTTSREKQRIKAWFRRLAKESGRAAEAKGREALTRAEIDAGADAFLERWGDKTWSEFEQFRHTIATWRNEAYAVKLFELHHAEDVEEEFTDEIEAEYGLMLDDTMYFLLWRSGKPPGKKDRIAA